MLLDCKVFNKCPVYFLVRSNWNVCVNKFLRHMTPRQLPFTSLLMKLWLIILAFSAIEAKTLNNSLNMPEGSEKYRGWPLGICGVNAGPLSSGIIEQTNTIEITVQANRLGIVTEANTLRIMSRLTCPGLLWRQPRSGLLRRLTRSGLWKTVAHSRFL